MTHPEMTWTEWTTAFLARSHHCYRCGTTGGQTRFTDPAPSPLRFRLLGGELLVPRCEHCARTGSGDQQAATSSGSSPTATP